MTHCTHYTVYWFPLVCDLLMSHPKSERHCPELDHQFIKSKVLISTSIHEFITVPLYSKWHQPHRSRHEKHFQFAKTRHT